jgi:HAD superfamily hydrolase (TIGR01490 family)
MATIALFDFDGTLTRNDSLTAFLKFYAGTRNYYWGIIILSPIIAGYKLNWIKNDVAKSLVLKYFLEGKTIEELEKKSEQFVSEIIPTLLRPEAIEKFTWHQQQGHRIIVVSASPELWIKPWCQKKNVEFIATKLATEKQLFTGEFLTPNCYGKEKLRRILLHIPQLLNQYSEIYVYGDSQGDNELLSLATHPFYRTF